MTLAGRTPTTTTRCDGRMQCARPISGPSKWGRTGAAQATERSWTARKSAKAAWKRPSRWLSQPMSNSSWPNEQLDEKCQHQRRGRHALSCIVFRGRYETISPRAPWLLFSMCHSLPRELACKSSGSRRRVSAPSTLTFVIVRERKFRPR